MADESDRPTAAIDAVPHPIVGFRLEDGVPAVRHANDAVAAAFGSVTCGEPVHEFFERAAVDGASLDELSDALAAGDAVDISVEADGRYRLQRVDAPADADCDGYVLATPQFDAGSAGLAPDRLASVISHDLRNPLDVANAHLRAARETGDEEHFDEVARSHDRMEQIIQDVLTLARGERAVDVSATVDVGRLAADAWSTVETDAVSLTVREDLPELRADPDRLTRLFENLYRNSVEHAGGDGAATEVTVGSVDGGFFVADDGRGIPPAERERVFEPGYSAGGPSGGTGLGLTIVERIAAAHDWRLELTESGAGGVRFEFHVSEATDAN
jgi:signal transduction histidine kinase